MKSIHTCIFLFLILISCKNQNADPVDPILHVLVKESYDYYFNSISNRNYQADHITGIYKLKDLAEKAKIDKRYHDEFMTTAIRLLETYSNIDFESEDISGCIATNGNCKIVLVEYMVVNSMIKWFSKSYYEMDYFDIIIHPKDPQIEQYQDFHSEIFIAFNNFYNRIALVVEGDTLLDGRGAALMYRYPTSQKGIFSTDAKIVITHKGDKIAVPFKLNYEVK